ncbi:hypothetical protein ATJ88_2864 [Isoptericola jiangsuensis]|uniref:Uncharacterized protein n=1 Tax=Isoptericola jiangsuensis TaxID=548579 RepID=A0A2A9F028_9MICO|nr:hypothetical protein [Isoptericola jiangsuensis]PFG44146.1 hypothetical protein ATJ88_2864 [Isoptericola jiangsuensis]
MTSARLLAAIDVFTDLGWRGASAADAESLPLGTPEQQRVARDGLAPADWQRWGRDDPPGGLTWKDESLLALFAVRVGVDARRAVRVLSSRDDDVVARLVAGRGRAFAARFVAEAARRPDRWAEHATSMHAGAVVRVVDALDLDVPVDVEYLKDWAVFARGALRGYDLPEWGDLQPHDRGWCEPDVVLRRLPEHLRAGVAAGVPATGPFGTVFAAAVERDLVERTEALDLALAALDAAQRPGDRKVWARLLTGPLAVTDDELVARTDVLVAILTHGDGPVVEAFGPRLVRTLPDDLLADVLLVTLPVRTKKVLRLLLTAAAGRPRPPAEAADVVAPLVVPHAAGPDRVLARAASALVAAWDLTVAGDDDAGEDGAPARWLPTPPVWEPPRFDTGEATPEALTAAAAVLTGYPEGVVDVEVERFLALANAVAGADREAARSALGGVRDTWVAGLRCVPSWVRGTPSPLADTRTVLPADVDALRGWGVTVWEPLEAREAQVVARLGEVPVLLSTPSWVDLRIDPADLVTRLGRYADAGVAVSEADLQLAATRVDPALADADVLAVLGDLAVPVVGQDGKPLPVAAGPLLRDVLRDPFREPGLVRGIPWAGWHPLPATPLPALAALPARTGRPDRYDRHEAAAFPTWGDATGEWWGSDDPRAEIALRQQARRSAPLTPGLAVNLVAAQRDLHPAAAVDGATAVAEAWERGLLRPGVADVGLLAWQETPTGLAAFAAVCRDLAADGLLSVVWPLLDDLLVTSQRGTRLLAGTAAVAETMQALAPAVRAAVVAGDAGTGALDLPGARALAARSGTSRAVVAARAVAADLPAPASPGAPAAPEPEPSRPFEEVWPAGAGTLPAVVDGAGVVASWVDPDVPGRMLAVDLDLPDDPGGPYRVVKAWFHDLEHEGQCAATSPAADASRPLDAWLRWDASEGRLAVSAHRDWRTGEDRPLSKGPVPPLTTSMVAVVLATLAHDAASTYHQRGILRERVGSAAVTVAVRALLASPDVSPARLVKAVDDDEDLLPVLWPLLVEPVRHAADAVSPPRWLNRVLDVALKYAPVLREAARRGLVPAEQATWPGLADLAARPGGAAASRKARALAAEVAGAPSEGVPGVRR